MQLDFERISDALVAGAKRYVDAALAPVLAENAALRAEIAELKARPVPVAKDGVGIAGCLKGADGFLVLTLSNGQTLPTGIKDGEPGASPAPLKIEDLRPMVEEEALKAVRDLTEVARADVARIATEGVADAVKALPTVEIQAAPELPDILALINEAVKALPAPEPGRDADMEAIAGMIDAAVGKAVDALPAAKDGVGLAGALITRGGGLVLTLTDGSTRDLGKVVGADADMVAIEARIKALVDAIPRPKDGLDAVGFDDLDLVEKPEGVFLEFTLGEKVKSFRLPVVIDRGVYKEGTVYRKGDGVTWAGSFWIAQGDANGRPDAGSDEWRLAVKKGRDGKDAQSKPDAVKL